jgi:hypothetical protein
MNRNMADGRCRDVVPHETLCNFEAYMGKVGGKAMAFTE